MTAFLPLNGSLYYYSMARYALRSVLASCHENGCHSILLPSYICNDIVPIIYELRYKIYWYEVLPDFRPSLNYTDWPIADIILFVNYFGFPQDFAPFALYSSLHSSILIEDNSHGFLSKDSSGVLLGSRADFGLFSIRKTYNIPNGAILWINPSVSAHHTFQQLQTCNSINILPLIKLYLFKIPLLGKRIAYYLSRIIRLYRHNKQFLFGSAYPLLPVFHPSPWSGLHSFIFQTNHFLNIEYRRKSYTKSLEYFRANNISAIFPDLPPLVSPYALPFRASSKNLKLIKHFCRCNCYELVCWPNLPTAISHDAPAFYRDVFLIIF